MSNAPKDARSFERIDHADLKKLAAIALKIMDRTFERRPQMEPLYREKLIGICLCQGGAEHFLRHGSPSTPGVHDFDLWAFYGLTDRVPFWNRKPSCVDFGPSKFGRSYLEPKKYQGRRVDVLWRAIPNPITPDPFAAIHRYFAEPRTASSHALRKKSAVLVWPDASIGRIIWSSSG